MRSSSLCSVLCFAAPLTAALAASPARADAPLLTIQQAYRKAVQSHPTMRVLRARVRQAEAARYRAWSALKPRAAAQGTFTHFDQEIAVDFGAGMQPLVDQIFANLPGDPPVIEGDPIVIQKQNQFGFNAVASLPLFVGPAYPAIGIARKQVAIAEKTEIRSRKDFLLQVASAYYTVVSQKEVVVALENKLAVDRKHLAAARARFEVGQAPRSTVLRADLVATQDAQRLTAQKNALRAARRQLAILVGAPAEVDVQRPPEPAEPGGPGSMREALSRREDYQAAGIARELAAQSRSAGWWAFAPTLDASWTYRWSEAAGFAGDNDTWSLMFTLSVPLYEGGVRYANLRESRAQLLEAEAQQQALAQQIESSVVQLKAQLASAEAGVVSARKALELARTTASDMDASFEAGVATQLDVLDANQRLLDAELALTRSLFDRDLARLSLAHALGTYDPLG